MNTLITLIEGVIHRGFYKKLVDYMERDRSKFSYPLSFKEFKMEWRTTGIQYVLSDLFYSTIGYVVELQVDPIGYESYDIKKHGNRYNFEDISEFWNKISSLVSKNKPCLDYFCIEELQGVVIMKDVTYIEVGCKLWGRKFIVLIKVKFSKQP